MQLPILSIIIPTHNRPQLLRRAIRSALAQTLENIEIIVVDDGSSPPVKLSDYPPSDYPPSDYSKVRLISLPESKGGSAARNVGAIAAKARWITYLDDDDELLPDMAQLSLDALQKASLEATLPQPVGVLSALVEVNEDQQIINTHRPPTLAKGHHFCLENIGLHQSFASKQTLVVERQVLLDIGGFDESFTSRVHTELFLRLNPVCSLIGLPNVTYRLAAHAGPRVSSSLHQRQGNFHRLLKKHRALFLSYPRRRYADFVFNHAYMLQRKGYHLAAFKAFWWAMRIQPVQALARLGSPYKQRLVKILSPSVAVSITAKDQATSQQSP